MKERLGREADGWTAKRAERELGKRLDAVERERWRKPDGTTFAAFAERFERDYLPSGNLKRSTLIAYGVDLRVYLVSRSSAGIRSRRSNAALVDASVADRMRAKPTPKTIGTR